MVNKAKRDASPSRRSTKEGSTSRAYSKSPGRPTRITPRSPITRSSRSSSRTRTNKNLTRKEPTSPKRDVSPKKNTERTSPGRPRGRPIKRSLETPEKSKESAYRLRTQVVDVDSDSDTGVSQSIHIEKPKAEVRGRARRLESDFVSSRNVKSVPDTVDSSFSPYVYLTRRALSTASAKELERITNLKHNDDSIQKLTEFSDEDVPVKKAPSIDKSERYSELRTIRTEFGGWIGALFIVTLLPFVMIGLYSLCDESHCSFTKLPKVQKYQHYSMFIDTTAVLIFSSFVALITILSAIPFTGSKMYGLPNKQGKLIYRMNAPFVAVIAGCTLIALEFFGIPITSLILEKYFQLLVSIMLVGALMGIYLYVRSYFVPISALNPYAISNSKIYNFCVGRELHPRIFGTVDVKILNLRIFTIGTMLLNSIFLYESIEFIPSEQAAHIFDFRVIRYNATLAVIASLIIIYCVDSLVFERTLLTSFTIQYEGVGYLTTVLNYSAILAVSAASKYVYDYNVTLPAWQLAFAIILFAVGYILYRGSNSQKDAFRQNPYNPSLSHLESLPTSQGKKLLVSSFWGFVRHPNYLGDILVHLSFALFVLTKPAVLFYVADVLYLLHRSYRDNVRCRQRYGTTWNRYCQRVKYVLIPKVY